MMSIWPQGFALVTQAHVGAWQVDLEHDSGLQLSFEFEILAGCQLSEQEIGFASAPYVWPTAEYEWAKLDLTDQPQWQSTHPIYTDSEC